MTTTAGTAPRDFADLKFMLMQRRDSFPKRLKQLADFAMRRPDEIALGNLVSIGQMAGVPASTLVRFAKSLGFDGFPELQALFRDQLRDRLPDYDERLRRLREREESRQGTLGLLDDLCEVAAASMAHLQATAEEADFERALARLADAQTIFVLGQRRAFPIASFMAYMLARIRCSAPLPALPTRASRSWRRTSRASARRPPPCRSSPRSPSRRPSGSRAGTAAGTHDGNLGPRTQMAAVPGSAGCPTIHFSHAGNRIGEENEPSRAKLRVLGLT